MPLIPPTLRRLAPRGGQGVRNAWCERDAPALEIGRCSSSMMPRLLAACSPRDSPPRNAVHVYRLEGFRSRGRGHARPVSNGRPTPDILSASGSL